MRGGRMIESKYLCTYDLFSSIPALDERKTVTQEIFEWNETMKPHLNPVSFGMAIGSTLPNSV
jgi:oleate hydratase